MARHKLISIHRHHVKVPTHEVPSQGDVHGALEGYRKPCPAPDDVTVSRSILLRHFLSVTSLVVSRKRDCKGVVARYCRFPSTKPVSSLSFTLELHTLFCALPSSLVVPSFRTSWKYCSHFSGLIPGLVIQAHVLHVGLTGGAAVPLTSPAWSRQPSLVLTTRCLISIDAFSGIKCPCTVFRFL